MQSASVPARLKGKRNTMSIILIVRLPEFLSQLIFSFFFSNFKHMYKSIALRVICLSMFRKEEMTSELHYQLRVNSIWTPKASQLKLARLLEVTSHTRMRFRVTAFLPLETTS